MMNKLVLATVLVCARSFLIALPIILAIESQSRASSSSAHRKRKRNRNAPPKYLQLKGKTFPYYDSWCELFGQFRATGSGARDHGDAEREPSPNPSTFYELIDDYEEGIDDSTVGDREEKASSVIDGSASGSRGKSKKTLPTSQSSLTCKASEALANLDGVFMRAERIFTEQEHIIKDDSKAEKALRLKKDLQAHPDLTLVERLRIIDHLLAHEGHYYYWTTMDAEERVEFIKVFSEGKLG